MNALLIGGTVQEISFSDIPILAGLDKINLARLIPNFEQLRVNSGEIILRHGDPWDGLYIINEGIVRVFLPTQGKTREIACLGPGDCFGEMALLTGEPGSANIEAMTDLSLLRLSKDCFDQMIVKHHSLGVNLAGLLASRLALTYDVVSGIREVAVPKTSMKEYHKGKISGVPVVSEPTSSAMFPIGFLGDKRVLCLLLTTAFCVVTGLWLRNSSFNPSHIILIEVLLGATIIWGLNLFSYHVVSLALPVLVVLFGVTTPAKALSGFSSPSWFLVLGVFAVSAAISKTGLLYRLVLVVLRRFPPSYIGQTFGLTFSGLLLTPVIPSTSGRVILASPLLLTLSEVLGFKKGSAGAIGMAMGCLLGFGHMSFMFMNGTASCFLVLGLLPPELNATITWGYWLKIAFPMGIAFFLLSYLSIIVLHRPKAKVQLNPFVTEAQLKTLGPMTTHEKISLATVVVSLIGFLTQPWHQINVAWVAILSFLILFASSVLDEKAVRSDIDWNSLISFGAILSFANVISETGLIAIIADGIKPYTELLAKNQLVFLLSVALAAHLLRFVLPLQPALLVCVLSIMPMLSTLGIHPFVIGLITLAAGNPWFLPYQDIMYQNLMEVTEGKLFTHEQTLKVAFARFLILLVAITISIPFWKQWHLLP